MGNPARGTSLRIGDEIMTPELESALSRFWGRVDKTDGCWVWTGRPYSERGYGRFVFAGRNVRVHRFSYEVHFGPIPIGMFVCHHCDNPLCVRPDHLFCGSNSDNMLDAIRKGRAKPPFSSSSKILRYAREIELARRRAKTTCPNGHIYTPETTRIDSHGWRLCRICSRACDRRRKLKRRGGW